MLPSSVAEGSLEVNWISTNNSLENNNLFQWCQLDLQICTLIDVSQLHVQFVTAVNYRHVNSERSSIWWRSTWSMDVGRWAAELVGTLMEFFMAAIYLIAGTCAPSTQRFMWLLELVIALLERRIDVSNCTARCHWCQKRCVIFGTS